MGEEKKVNKGKDIKTGHFYNKKQVTRRCPRDRAEGRNRGGEGATKDVRKNVERRRHKGPKAKRKNDPSMEKGRKTRLGGQESAQHEVKSGQVARWEKKI